MGAGRAVAVRALALLTAACTVEVDERRVFHPQAETRRLSGGALTLPGEAALAQQVVIEHRRLDAPFGPLAVTEARWRTRVGPRRLIVSCGGNATDRLNSGIHYLTRRLPYGDVQIFDYPGYGDSAGTPSVADVQAAVKVLAADLRAQGVTGAVAWGHSLGGFVCAALVREAPEVFGAAVIEASAPNAQAVGRALVPGWLRPFVRVRASEAVATYDVPALLEGFRGPVLVIGAGADRVLPVALSRDLAAALKTRGAAVTYVELPGAGHQDPGAHPDHAPAVRAFLNL